MSDYVFYNNNPDLLIENDCVTRAISLASGLPYETIEDKLYLTSKLFECPKLCLCCYENLLNFVFGYEQIYGVEGMSIEEFANYHPIGTYIIRIEGHLTTLIDGVIYDLWNCSDKVVDVVWKVC